MHLSKAHDRAVRRASFDPVLPAFDCAINDRGRLTILKIEREPLRCGDLLPIEPIRHVHDIPVVQIGELGRRPLHVFARGFAIAADMVRIDGRLVPIDVQDDVVERSGAAAANASATRPGVIPPSPSMI